MRKTKIVCTIGPASDNEETLRKMILAGMSIARLNFSHGTHEEHKLKIELIKKLRSELAVPVAILLDTKGPEIRTKKLKNGSITLTAGEEFTLTANEIEGDERTVSITYKNLPKVMSVGNTLLLDDGLCELTVKKTTDTDIVCDVVVGGILGDNKGINIPGVDLNMPYLSETDKNDIIFGIENNVDFIALSFIRNANDIKDVKHVMHQRGCYDIELVAKIENSEGVKNILEIINVSDGIMVARGDMGVEIPFEELPHIQKQIITACYTAGKKVITATQMLESMIKNPRPTRAEITDVANAVYDGTSALMLSGETAMGKYPIKSVETMAKIAEKTESFIDYKNYVNKNAIIQNFGNNITNAISHATCATAHDLGAAVIIAVTLSGNSARMISRFRPHTPIIAVTPNEKTYYQLALSWGVTPVMNNFIENTSELFGDVIRKVTEKQYVKNGDLVVITGSTQYSSGATNTISVHIIGNILICGTGNGHENASGRVYVVKENDSMSGFIKGDIIVTTHTTGEILQNMHRCAAVITEEKAGESGIVAAGLALFIPVISDAERATAILKTGTKIKIETTNGYIYNTDIVIP